MAEGSEEIVHADCWRCATELADAAEAAGADAISTALHLFGVMYLCPTCGKRCPKATDHRLACPDCDGVDDVRSVGQVIHGVECYEAWRDGHDCPHEQEEGE